VKGSVLAFPVLLFLFLTSALGAEDDSQDFQALLAQHQYAISVEEGKLTGPGADWLNTEIKENDFFIFGEQHATKEIAQTGIMMFDMALADGYEVAAVEMGRFETGFVENMLREDGMDAYKAYLAEGLNLLSVPFFSFREEAPLLEKAIAANDRTPAIWGLDQEFIGASLVALNILQGMAETEEERVAVETLLAQARQVPFIMGVLPAEAFLGLKAAFENANNPEAKELADEIILTNRIYAPFTGRGGSVYLANYEREQFMKATLRRYLETYQDRYGNTPRVFMKFGANHGSRGRSPTDVFALGNFVMEYGALKGLGVFNIHADCLGGEQLNVQTGGPVPCESYFLSPDSPFQKFALPERMTLFDLKSLRAEKEFLKSLDEKSRTLVYAYDALLIIRDTTPASLFEGTLPDFGQ